MTAAKASMLAALGVVLIGGMEGRGMDRSPPSFDIELLAPGSDDWRELVRITLPFAERMITKYRGFQPFAAAVGVDGKTSLVAVASQFEHPSSDELIRSHGDVLEKEMSAGKLRATILLHDTVVKTPGAAHESKTVVANLTDATGRSRVLYVAYVLTDNGARFGAHWYRDAGTSAPIAKSTHPSPKP